MNKRADVPLAVAILVIATMAITSIAMYSFFMSAGKTQGVVLGVGFVDDVNLKELAINFYVQQAGERAFVKTYKEIADNGDYLELPAIKDSGGIYKFAGARKDIDELFKEKFYDNFKNEFAIMEFDEDYLEKDFRKNLLFNKFVFTNFSDENGLKIIIEGMGIEEGSDAGDVKVVYSPKISAGFNFEKLGLHSFKYLEIVKDECILNPGIMTFEECLNFYLFNFNAKVSDEDAVSVESKKTFLIGGKFEKIRFSFIPA